MRRGRRSSFKPQKQFIHTFHINQVPLPYYNPLQDPYLRGYFSNKKVEKQLQNLGFFYEPKKQYPYELRRTKNAYKHHRENSCDVPPNNLIRSRELANSCFFSSQKDGNQDECRRSFSPLSPQLKKRAESEILNNKISPRRMEMSELVQTRPATQVQRKPHFFPEGKFRSKIFQSKSTSMNKIQNKRNPQMIE